jgi:hypothetical protein
LLRLVQLLLFDYLHCNIDNGSVKRMSWGKAS